MRVGIVAGEPSGDLLGAHLIEALNARRPDLQFVGIGGSRMVAAGATSLFPMDRLAVRGYVEVLRHFPELLRIRGKLRDFFLSERPRMFIGVDSPDFNLGLELALRRAGITTVHYVSPTIWAWRRERLARIREAVSHMLVILPFEEELYRREGIPATFVGHPLADQIPLEPDRASARVGLGIEPGAPVIALLPGSRRLELRDMGALFVLAAQEIRKRRPEVQFLAPMAGPVTRSMFEAALRRHGEGLSVRVLDGQSQEAMTAADAVLVASGTASLEAALLKRPMVITYRLPRMTGWLVRRKMYLPYVGMPNILAGRFAVPELIQDDATPERLAESLIAQMEDREGASELAREFTRIHHQLRRDSGHAAAQALLPLLGEAIPA